MRLATFLTISVAFHAAAFSYPVHFAEFRRDPVFPVVLLNGPATHQPAAAGAEHSAAARGSEKEKPPAHRVHQQSTVNPMPSERPALPAPETTQVPLSSNESPVEIASAQTTNEIAAGLFAAPAGDGVGFGNGKGTAATFGTGNGFASGGGTGGDGSDFVQPGYVYSPRPEYPISARRDGREGRVLLRVLVDERGKSKTVEVNQSSGSEALDRAAAEAINHWRFSPARRGNRPVESWVRVPIEFQLKR
jgi:protein TonB